MRRLLAVSVVAVLALAGCGDDETTETGGQTTETTMDMNMPGMTMHGDDHHMGSSTCEPSGTSLSIVAQNTKFDKDCLAAPVDQAVTIAFDNKDSAKHSLVVLKSHTSMDVLARADVFEGPKTVTLNVPAQPAGTYAFHCEVHPQAMSGTYVVK